MLSDARLWEHSVLSQAAYKSVMDQWGSRSLQLPKLGLDSKVETILQVIIQWLFSLLNPAGPQILSALETHTASTQVKRVGCEAN